LGYQLLKRPYKPLKQVWRWNATKKRYILTSNKVY